MPQYPQGWTSADEGKFRQWYGAWAAMNQMHPNPDDKDQHFDYRAAFKKGVRPPDIAKGEHWPSGDKDEKHPNRVVGGFDTVTNERVPFTRQASEPELVRRGWSPESATRLTNAPKSQLTTMLDDLERSMRASSGAAPQPPILKPTVGTRPLAVMLLDDLEQRMTAERKDRPR